VSVVVKPVMNAIVQVWFGVGFRSHTLFLFCFYLSRCLDIRCSTAGVPWGFGLQGARAPWALVRSGVSAVPCRMLDGRDRWFPVGFLAMILIGDCGDLCVGGYVCMCFGYFVWFAYFLMIFCFCQYLCFYRSLVGFFYFTIIRRYLFLP
jgi:hypothetical protein